MNIDKSNNDWCQYSTLPQPNIVLRRHDDGRQNRFYYYTIPQDGQLITKTAIGITSLLSLTLPTSPFLTQWKLDNTDHKEILTNASDYGTIYHLCASEWIVKRSIPKEVIEAARDISIKAGMGYDTIDKDILALMKWVEDYNIQCLLSEAMLLSEPVSGESYALTLDLVHTMDVKETRIDVVQDGVWSRGERKGQPKMVEVKTDEIVTKVAVTDFKSNFQEKQQKSFYESHLFQVIAGAKAVKYNYPDLNIDLICNFSPVNWRTTPNYNFKIWEPTETDYKLFDMYVEIGRLRGFFSPSGSKFIPPSEFVEGVTSSDYKFLDYISFVNEVLIPGQQVTEEKPTEENQADYEK